LRVGAVCMRSTLESVEENLGRMESLVEEGSRRGAELLCFPELCVTGYSLRRAKDLARAAHRGRVAERLAGMARRWNLAILAGYAERSREGRPYITHLAAGPGGLLGLHRKTHLSPPESDAYTPGKALEVHSYRGIVFGMQLCWEAHFPEISTLMALKGATLLLFPHASPRGTPEEKLSSWLRHLPARAFDNTAYAVACNQAGETAEGLSFPAVAVAVDPDGRVVGSYAAEEDHILMVDVDPLRVSRLRRHPMRYFLGGRSPELYGPLCRRRRSQ